MVTIGDVLAVIGAILVSVLSLWAMVIALSLLFVERTQRAQRRLERAPGKVTLFGAVTAVVVGGLIVALLNHPHGALKLVGWVMYLALLVITAFGFSGLAGLVAQRLAQLEPSLTPYGALSRGAMLCVLATLVPLVGWFVVGPLTLFASVGAGLGALFARNHSAVSAEGTA